MLEEGRDKEREAGGTGGLERKEERKKGTKCIHVFKTVTV